MPRPSPWPRANNPPHLPVPLVGGAFFIAPLSRPSSHGTLLLGILNCIYDLIKRNTKALLKNEGELLMQKIRDNAIDEIANYVKKNSEEWL